MKNIIESASTAINRLTQYADEAFGENPKTIYEPEVIALFNKADNIHSSLTKLNESIISWLNPNTAERVQEMILSRFMSRTEAQLPSSRLSDSMLKASQDLQSASLANSLSMYGRAMSNICQAEQKLANKVKITVLESLREFFDLLWPDIQRARKTLEGYRLDVDSAINKKNRQRDPVQAQNLQPLIDRALGDYTNQLNFTRELIPKLDPFLEKLDSDLKRMASAHMSYHANCLEELQNLSSGIDYSSYLDPGSYLPLDEAADY